MPEGDTIYRVANTLRKALVGSRVTGYSIKRDTLSGTSDDLNIRTISSVESLGKNLVIVFRNDAVQNTEALFCPVPPGWPFTLRQDDIVLHTHMRMTGSWHIYRPEEPWRKPARLADVILRTESFIAVCFSAPVVELLSARETVRHPMLITRGTDVIKDEFDSQAAFRGFRQHNHLSTGIALMNQRLMAGVGNVYKSEVLFIRRLSPFAPVSSLTDEALNGLIGECHTLLRLNRTRGLRRTRFGLNEKDRLWVYGKSGEPCSTCGTRIQMRRQGLDGRSTYYCPLCQSVELSHVR